MSSMYLWIVVGEKVFWNMLIEIIFETTFNLFENLLNCVNYIEGWEAVVEKCLNFAGLKRPYHYANLNLTENKGLLKNPTEDQDL